MKIRFISLFIFAILVLSSCSNFQKLQNKGTVEERYAAAIKYYEKKDYYRAGILFEGVQPLFSGKKEAEKIQLYLAYCQYNQKEYMMASYYFKKFYDTYPRSESIEEAMHMYAMALYKLSPKYNIDQTNTYQAINAFQNFLNRFPKSSYAEEANQFIDLMQQKLERKAYESAKLHARIHHYKAAVVSIDNFAKDYPDSKYNEELSYLKLESQYTLAKKSMERVLDEEKRIIFLKKERLIEAEQYYFALVDKYPKSEYVKPAENMYKSIQQQIRELN